MLSNVAMEGEVLLFSTLLINPLDRPVPAHSWGMVSFFTFAYSANGSSDIHHECPLV